MRFKIRDKVLIHDAGGNPREGIIVTVDFVDKEYGVEIEGSDLVWIYEEDQVELLTVSVKGEDKCTQCSDRCSSLDLFRHGCKIKNAENYERAIKRYYKE